jgi:hypothetical protein
MSDKDWAIPGSQRVACDFCGWESDVGGWIELRKKSSFGTGPGSKDDHWLCQFCRSSLVVSAWLTNGRCETADRDRLMVANMLLAAQGIEAIRCLMLTLKDNEL